MADDNVTPSESRSKHKLMDEEDTNQDLVDIDSEHDQ